MSKKHYLRIYLLTFHCSQLKKKKSNPLSQPEGTHGYEVLATPIFLATVHVGGWPVLSLNISSSHEQCAVSVLITAEFARGRRWSRNLDQNFCPGQNLNPLTSPVESEGKTRS